MKLKKALKKFESLKEKHESGKMNDKKFEKLVNKISVTSEDGTRRKVDIDGNWYKNVNDEWIKDTVKPEENKGPETVIQLLAMIFKSMLTNLPKRLIFMLVVAGIAFLIHTYLVIYPNGGYWPGTNATLDKILALKGNEKSGLAFWTILSFLMVSLFSKIRSLGFMKVISGLITGPSRVVRTTFSKPKKYLSFLMITTAILLLVAEFLIKNSTLAYIFIIAAVLAIVTFKADLSYLFIRLGYQDIRRLFKRKTIKFNDMYFDGFQLSIILAMLLYILLPYRPISIYLFTLLAIGSLFYKKFGKSNKLTEKIMMLGILGLNLSILFVSKAYADDGGVYEAGGFIPWITSPGAFTAVTLGLPPAIGAGVGGVIGLITGTPDFTDTFTNDDFGEYDETEADFGEYDEDEADFEEYDEDEAEFEEFDEDEANFEEFDETEFSDEENDLTVDDGDYNTDEILDDLYDSLFGNPVDQIEGLVGLTEVGMDLSVDASDFVLTSTALGTLFDGYDSIVPDWIEDGAKEAANEAWDYMGATKDLMDLAGLIPKDSPIPGIMDAAGIFKDALGNIELGDSMGYAAVKSLMSNKIKGFIFDKKVNPGLIIMDTLTTVLIGGSEASKIISPGKTIQGGLNFIMDKVTDIYNGTDDVSTRLKRGDYGGLWQVADESTELLAEAVYNPKEFIKDIGNVINSDEFYDGMYETNKDLWAPKEGSWAIKRAGCYIGEKTCEGFIKIADGAHLFSSWLQSKF